MKKKYIVHGLGLSNNAALKLLKEKKLDFELITKENQDDPAKIEFLKENKTELIFIKAPGIPWNLKLLQYARSIDIPIITEVNLGLSFWQKNRPKVIGVTGTNGKSSFVKFLNDYLLFLGINSKIAGNYGIAVCDLFMECRNNNKKVDYLIVELSSFQTEIKPSLNLDLAICLNISPSHMERYSSFKDYKEAKLNIKNHVKSEGIYLESKNHLKKIPKKFYISGKAGIESYSNVIQVLESFNLETSKVEEFCKHFKPLPYRQEVVFQNQVLSVVNDSKSTNWDSTLALVKSYQLENKQISLIVGGKNRDKEIFITKELVEIILKKNITVFCFGEVAELLAKTFHDVGVKAIPMELVEVITQLKKITGIILFSPAFPSFDQFRNYIERGQYFTNHLRNFVK